MAARGQISNVGRWIMNVLGHNYTWFKPHKIAWKWTIGMIFDAKTPYYIEK